MTFFPSFFRLLLLQRFSSKTGPKMVSKWSQYPSKIDPYRTTCLYIQKVCFWMTLLWKTYIFGSTFGPIFFLKSTKESMKKEIASSACQKSIFDRFWNHFGRGQGVQRTSLFPTHAAFPPRRLIENEVFFSCSNFVSHSRSLGVACLLSS